MTESLIFKLIVIDRNLAMMNTIDVLFSSSINLLCRFHIKKNIEVKCKEYVLKKRNLM